MWWTKIAQQENNELKQKALSFPIAGDNIGGLSVSTNIPNTDSIDATFYNYEVLPGIREIPISQFNSSPTDLFYDANDIKSTKNLAQQIQQNKTISPLIIVVDNEATPYILEGAHRLGALHLLGIQTFPALVVLDYDSEEK